MGSPLRSTRLVVKLSLLMVLTGLNFGEIASYTHGSVGLYRQNYIISSSIAGRVILESENDLEPVRDLADTVRVDPLDKLKKYRGGYDITNKHYWSSTAFTGIYGYAIGAAWLLCGIAYGGFLLVTALCCSNKKQRKLKKKPPCSRHCYLLPVLLGTSFTILAIVAYGLALGGSSKFHSRAKTVMDIIIDTADGASGTIYNVTGAMKNIRDNLGTSDQNTEKASGFFDSTSQRLDSEAAEISRQAKKNRRLINKGLKIIYIATIITISLSLIAVVSLSLTGFLKFHRVFYMFIILCWLLGILCWVCFGLYFFLEKFTGDTCTALKDFQQDPNNNSLSSILPCDELDSAKPLLMDTRVGIYNLINEVNENISESRFSNMVRVCNPFSEPPAYSYQPENCQQANTVRVGDIPQVLKIFICSDESGTCNDGQFISPKQFKTVEVYTTSMQNIIDAFPGMERLVDCQVVTDAFTEILSKHCKPLKKYAKMVWASMVVLSTVMVALILIWTIKAHHDLKRHFFEGSIKPDHVATNNDHDSLESCRTSAFP